VPPTGTGEADPALSPGSTSIRTAKGLERGGKGVAPSTPISGDTAVVPRKRLLSCLLLSRFDWRLATKESAPPGSTAPDLQAAAGGVTSVGPREGRQGCLMPGQDLRCWVPVGAVTLHCGSWLVNASRASPDPLLSCSPCFFSCLRGELRPTA
jgi:hypothetical protein